MFAELLQLLIGCIQFIWPLHSVAEYEQAGKYVCGCFRGVVGRGVKGKFPWFMRYINVTTVPYPVSTGRMDITLQDHSTLSFDATATIRVFDVDLALNAIDNFHHSATMKVAAILATKLAEVDADRLVPAKRGRLLSDLRRWTHEETSKFGVETQDIAFNSFVLNIRTFRLLTDASAPLGVLE